MRTKKRAIALFFCIISMILVCTSAAYQKKIPEMLDVNEGITYFLNFTNDQLLLDEDRFFQELEKTMKRVDAPFIAYDPYAGLAVFQPELLEGSHNLKDLDSNQVLISTEMKDSPLYSPEIISALFPNQNFIYKDKRQFPDGILYVQRFEKEPFLANRWIVIGGEEVQNSFQRVFSKNHLDLNIEDTRAANWVQDILTFYSFPPILSLFIGTLLTMYCAIRGMSYSEERVKTHIFIFGLIAVQIIITIVSRGLLLPFFVIFVSGLLFLKNNEVNHNYLVKLAMFLCILLTLFLPGKAIHEEFRGLPSYPKGSYTIYSMNRSPRGEHFPLSKAYTSDIFYIPKGIYLDITREGETNRKRVDLILAEKLKTGIYTSEPQYQETMAFRAVLPEDIGPGYKHPNLNPLDGILENIPLRDVNEIPLLQRMAKHNEAYTCLVTTRTALMEAGWGETFLGYPEWVIPTDDKLHPENLLNFAEKHRFLLLPSHQSISSFTWYFLGAWILLTLSSISLAYEELCKKN